jgi:hypothetical protein
MNHKDTFPEPFDYEELWKRLKRADGRDYCMMGSSNNNPSGDSAVMNGITQQHAYTILSVHEIDYNGCPTRLMRLRNPWGQGEWQGDWSDNWPGWTDDLKAELDWSTADDGKFFMTFEDYQKNFEFTDFNVLQRDGPPKRQFESDRTC